MVPNPIFVVKNAIVSIKKIFTSYKQKNVHEVLVNRFKLAQEKVGLGELTIAVDWDVKLQTKQRYIYIQLFFSPRIHPPDL